MLTKTIPFDAAKFAIKAEGDGPGQIEGYASVFGGVDSYGDTIEPGAYLETIPDFIVRGALHHEHDTRIRLGTISAASEDGHGLLIRADFHSDAEAQRIRTQIAERLDRGKFMGLSIGYEALDMEWRTPKEGEPPPPFGDKIRVLKRIKLYEVSVVSVPADSDAEIIAAKSVSFEDRSEELRTALREWVNHLKAGSAVRIKDGKEPFTAQRRDQMTAVGGSLQEAVTEITALATPPPPPEVVNVGLELRRRRYAAAGIVLERP